MSGSDNNTTSIGIKNPSQPFENSISASHFTLLSVLGILGITCLFYLVCKFMKKMFYHHSTANVEPIYNIGTYNRRASTVQHLNISPAHQLIVTENPV